MSYESRAECAECGAAFTGPKPYLMLQSHAERWHATEQSRGYRHWLSIMSQSDAEPYPTN